MKLKCFLAAALLGMVSAFSAHAQTTDTNGDLFLWVGDITQSDSYVVDLGQQFNWNTSFSIPISALTTDLDDVIGSSWQTDPNVYFAVVGGTTASATTEHLVLSNSVSSPYNYTKTSESEVASALNTIIAGWQGNSSSESGLSGGNSQALEEVNSAGNSFDAVMAGNFGSFTSGADAPESSPLYLDNLISSSPSLSAPGLTLGSFALDGANNSLDFTTAAVPEPSTYAAIIMGAAALFTIRRRRA